MLPYAASGRTIEASPQYRQALRRQKLRERIRRKLEGEAVAHGMSFESWMRVRERNDLPGLDRLVDATFAEREAIARLERARLEELRLEQSEGRGIRRKPVVLPDFIAGHPPLSGAHLRSVLRVERIIRRFCRVFRVTCIDLLSHRRNARLTLARKAIAYWIYRGGLMSFPEMGERFDRDHTSILYQVRTYPAERAKAGRRLMPVCGKGRA